MAKAATARKSQEDEVMQSQTGDDEVESILEYSEDISTQERPPVLPIGEYRAEVSGVQLKHGKESGKPYLNVKASIGPDDQPADFVEALGTQQKVAVFGMVFGCEDNPVSRFNMRLFCEALGAPMSSRINPKDFIGKTCKVQVEHQNDLQGLPQPRVRKFLAA